MKIYGHRNLLLIIIIPLLTLACTCNLLTPFITPTLAPTSSPPPPQTNQVPVFDHNTNEEALLVALYTRINPAVVNIITYSDQGRNVLPSGQGSGFIYDQEAHVVTNAHVVHGADQVEVIFSDNTISSAKIVGEDLHSDLAVIEAEELPAGIYAIPLGNMDEVAVGQTVVAIGNPFGLGGTLTKGVVSAMGRTIPALTAFSIPQSIQTDAPINPGNSGGPLLNLQGELVGVNAQIETDGASRVNSGVGFAIPVNIVSRVVPELINEGEFDWAWLGVAGRSVNPPLVTAMDLPVNKGAYITEVVEGGPSENAGLHGAERETTIDGRLVEIGGDVIVQADDQPISSFGDLLIYIAIHASPGQQVALTVIRDGKSQEFTVKLGVRPEESYGLFQPPTP